MNWSSGSSKPSATTATTRQGEGSPMGKLWESLAVMPRGLRHKLYVAVALMVVVPLGILCILAAFVLPNTRDVIRTALGMASAESALLWLGVPAQTWWVLLLVFSAA